MTSERFNKNKLCFALFTMLVFLLISAFCGSIGIEKNIANAEEIHHVNITLAPDYELNYKGESFLEYDGSVYTPDDDLFDILQLKDDLDADVTLLTKNDIVVSLDGQEIKNADTYSVTFTIDSVNTDFYGNATLNVEISPRDLVIEDSDADTYFDIDDVKTYDSTADLEFIDILSGQVVGINSEIVNISSVDAEYISIDAGIVDYIITFTIDDDNYNPLPIFMSGIYAGEIEQYLISSPVAENFVGFNRQKEYDSTKDVLLYDVVFYIKQIDISIYESFRSMMVNDYFLTIDDFNSFFAMLTCEEYSVNSLILRFSNFELRNFFSQVYGDFIQARDAAESFSADLEDLLTALEVNYVVYDDETIADLFFVEVYEELILLSGAGHITAEYTTKDVGIEKTYDIFVNSLNHNNYEISGNYIQGDGGGVTHAIVGVINPTIYKNYGDTLTDFDVEFITEALLNNHLVENVTVQDNEILLPYPVSYENRIFFNRILNFFYADDLTDSEITAILNVDHLNITIIEDNAINVYQSLSTKEDGPTRYVNPLDVLTNYAFIDILWAYGNENYYEHPGVIVKPLEVTLNDLTINTQKAYDSTNEIIFNSTEYSGFLLGEQDLFELDIVAHYKNMLGEDVFTVADNLILSEIDFRFVPQEGVLGYSEEEIQLMSYNYIVNNSFAALANSDTNLIMELLVINNSELEEWVSYNDYINLYSDKDILEYRFTGINQDIIQILKADLFISIETGQELVYGNDILEQLQYNFQNFYQNDPDSIFTLDYTIKDILENIITDPGNNNFATLLLPSDDYYSIALDGTYIADATWLAEFGANYNINIVTTAIDLKINKGYLTDIVITDSQKNYGEYDPAFSFESISNYRDCDYDSLVDNLYKLSDDQTADSSVHIGLLEHPYYEYSYYAYGTLHINVLSIDVTPDYIDIAYGTAQDSIYTFNSTQSVETELFGTIDIDVIYNCLIPDFNATQNYIYEVTSINVFSGDESYGNIVFNVIDGENKIKINPLQVEINLLSVREGNDAYLALQKDYDGTPLVIKLGNIFDYLYHLYDPLNPDDPISYEDRIGEKSYFILNNLPYEEKLYFAKIEGNIGDNDYDRSKIGTKQLAITQIVLAKTYAGVTYQVPSENYNFVIEDEGTPILGEINKRPITLNPAPMGQQYFHIYDGNKYTLDFSQSMATNLIAGHSINESSIWFETADADASQSLKALYLIDDSLYISDGVIEYTENYELVYNNNGFCDITARQVAVSIGSEIYLEYDGDRTAISLSDGILYSVKGQTYTQRLDGLGQPMVRTIIFTNAHNSEEPAFVYDHSVTGNLISVSSNIGRSAMVADGSLQIENTLNTNYRILYENQFMINITLRNITIDINPNEETVGIPEIVYSGQPYSIELTNEMSDALVDGHNIIGYRETTNADVNWISQSPAPKNINTSRGFAIFDGETNVTTNYNVIFTQRQVIILPKDLVIDINLDINVSKQKSYNGIAFVLNITTDMASGIASGEFVHQGTVSTIDGNAYTIVGEEAQLIPKEVEKRTSDLDLIIRKADDTDSTGNYNIIWGDENYVTIIPKEVRLDMSQDYYEMSFIYTGDYIKFPITNSMIINMNNEQSGLMGEHFVSSQSNPLRAADKDVGENIDVIYSHGDIIIVDEYVTNNYNINYIPQQITITQRDLTINVSNDTEVELSVVYNGNIYVITLTNEMDDNIEDPNRGLADGHNLVGTASTFNADVGTNKNLTYTISIEDEWGDDSTANYSISYINTFVTITAKVLELDLNIDVIGGHSKPYDGSVFEVYITESMLQSELADNQEIILALSYIRTKEDRARIYDLNSQEDITVYLEIQESGIAQNLVSNYEIVFINNAQIEIVRRKIYITVRNDEGYYTDGEDDFISGLSQIYNEIQYTVTYDNYYIDNADNDNDSYGYELAAGHLFTAGSRITQTMDAASKILLVSNQDAVIRNASNTNVTSNYLIEYQQSYFEISKRKIKFDVARDQLGNTDDYDLAGSFLTPYSNSIYERKIQYYMVVSSLDYPGLTLNHTIFDGYLITENPYVERDIEGNVIPKPLIWDTQRPLTIHNQSGVDVTSNYDIDTTDTQENFVERVVTIQPRLLVIDIKRGVQYDYEKQYNGEIYTVYITNAMVVDNIPSAGGLLTGHTILANSGTLVTEDANVALDESNNVTSKILIENNLMYIQDISDLSNENVVNNYDIRYHQDVNNQEIWMNLLQGESFENYEDFLPQAKITKTSLTLSLSTTQKLQKYYDSAPFDVTVSFACDQQENIIFTHEAGKLINNNPANIFTLRGLVKGENVQINLYTADGNVSAQKVWFYNDSSILVTKGLSSTKNNYNIQIQTTNFAHILPRQICLDVNQKYPEGIVHIYNGNIYVLNVDNEMVLLNSEDDHLLESSTDSLGLLSGHIISGIRESQSAQVGLQVLRASDVIQLLITDSLGNDVTSQYHINEATGQYVEIQKAELIIDANIIQIAKQKVYDGLPFIINLDENIVNGMVNGHYVASGFITTADKNVGEAKAATCDTSNIVIMQLVEGADDIDVTHNYKFTYMPLVLDIIQKQIQIMAASDYYKPYNEDTNVTLSEKHYTYRIGDICEGDVVRLIEYTANFSSPLLGTTEAIEVSDLVIDNQNYILENTSFTITGQILSYQPNVKVTNSTQINNRDGVIFVYDGNPKTANYTVSGLDGADVKHTIKYQDNQAEEGVYLFSAPVNVGLYKMILESDDEDYTYWEGTIIMIRIDPAEVDISFRGSLNQTYGNVTDITARLVSSGGLDITITPECSPTSLGYSYPNAGEYQLRVSYNADPDSPEYNPNYYPASRTATLTINKKSITVEYGSVDNLVYDGTVKNIPVSIASGILPADLEIISDNNLIRSYSGDYSTVKNAGNYNLTVSIDNRNYSILNNTIDFSIQKKQLTIKALLNNVSRITIYEGDALTESIVYEGFVTGENRNSLSKPAYLPYVPRMAINDHAITPFGAESQNYTFNYVPAYITIIETKVSQVSDENGFAILTGEYGSFAGLEVAVIETSVTNPVFYQINEKVQRYFGSSDLLEKYRIKLAYSLTLNDTDEDTTQSSTIRLKLSPDLQNEDNFMVLHFNKQGEYELVSAYKEGEYIIFTASEMGDFVILTPRRGLSTTTTILLFLAPITLFVIIILFYLVFRRKYDVD